MQANSIKYFFEFEFSEFYLLFQVSDSWIFFSSAIKGMLSLKISSITFLFISLSVLTLHRYFSPHPSPTDSTNFYRKMYLLSWKSNKT